MQAIGFYIALPFLYFFSILPHFILYGVADFFYVLIYHVFGYRKKVVTENLKRSFPEKSEEEIGVIRRKFYRFFCDFIFETLKSLTISKKEMKKRCYYPEKTINHFNKYADAGKSVIIVLGHYGNWEWGGAGFSLTCKHDLFVIFHPLHNKYFNDFVYKMRTRFGTQLIPMRETVRDMLKNKNKLTATAFIADQTPPPESAYWTTFLNQDTPVFFGTEKIAKKFNYPIVYVSVKKVKRGHYEIQAETLVETPAETTEGEITEIHTRRLEQDIIAQPETWLWSHRRWKHKRPVSK